MRKQRSLPAMIEEAIPKRLGQRVGLFTSSFGVNAPLDVLRIK
jgi:hypothetical protein